MDKHKSNSRIFTVPVARVLMSLALLVFTTLACAAEPVKIGVQAFRSKTQMLAQWQPLAVALKHAIPERDFIIEPLTNEEMGNAVATRQVDFVLTNPSNYVVIAKRSGLSSPLATLADEDNGREVTVFGGIIFCRAGQEEISSLTDIAGKTIAATTIEALGSYQMQAYELSRAGVRLPQDARLIFTGPAQDNVVAAVLSGRADVGFVRTGLLESMVREGKLDMAQLKIINRQNLPGYTAALSTHLYPNWPFAALPHIDENLARRVAVALFSLEENIAVTRAMRIHGFVVPADYTPVEALLQELHLPPYDVTPEISLSDVWGQYRWWIATGLVAAGLILLLGYRLWLSNNRLRTGIAERRKAEEAGRAASQYARSLIEASLDPLVTISAEGKITDVNKATEKVTGRTRAELIGTDFSDYFTEPDKAGAGYRQVFAKGFVTDYPLALLRRDGHVTDVLYNASIYRSEAGEVLGVFAAARDITELKRAEEVRTRLAAIVESSSDAIIGKDLNGIITSWNKGAEKIYGYRADEIIGKPITVLAPPSRHAEIEGFLEKIRRGETVVSYESDRIRKDGTWIYVALTLSPIRDAAGKISGISTIARDITERKNAEFVLRQSEEALKEAQRLAHVGSWHMDLATNQVVWSEVLYKMYGFDPSQPPPLYTESMKLFTPESWERLSSAITRAAETGIPYELELEMVPKAGGLGWMLARGELVRDERGVPVRVRGVVMDITERKRADEQLRRSEHGLAEAQRIAHLGNWELDLVHNVLIWSDEIYRIFEIDPEKFGASYEAFLNAIHPDDRELVNNAYTESLKSKKPYDIAHRLLMRDGRVKYVNEKCETYYDEEGKPLRSVGTVHDITELKRAEDEVNALNRELEQRVIARTTELEAANKELEAFSFSVSHDLRTPLRAIDGFSQILLEDYESKLDAEGGRLLHVVRDNTSKMGALIDDILKFSRAGRVELSFVKIDMEALVREVYAELMLAVAAGNLQLEIEVLPPAQGDRAMMHQVFANLLSNAIKFSRNSKPPTIRVGAYAEGDETVYFVRDNGVGFDMQYAGKLFGVFQRLHGVDEFEGTGIGLAIVKRIVTRHSGRVWAEGKVGEGATLYFSLPRADQA